MNETTADQTAEPTENADTAPVDMTTEDAADEQHPGREAAKYRRQLRDTETERDSLRERVTSYERAEVERFAAGHLADPADLWVAGTELESLRGEDGAIDQGKIKAAISDLLEQRPHWKKQQRQIAPPANLVSGATGHGKSLAPSWSDAFANARGK